MAKRAVKRKDGDGSSGSRGLAAFVDLVGVKRLASTDPGIYHDRLAKFHEYVIQAADSLPDGTRVYFFSDCLFVGSIDEGNVPSARGVVLFLKTLRERLFSEGLFFKASLGAWSIDPRDAAEDPRQDGVRHSRVCGNYFGVGAASLYGEHEALKGIGVAVCRRQAEGVVWQGVKVKGVQSCYVTNSGERRSYEDLLAEEFADHQKCSVLIERVVDGVLGAKTVDLRLARYYITVMICLIRSVGEVVRGGKGGVGFHPLFEAMMSNRVRMAFRRVVGWELVFFTFVSEFLGSFQGKLTHEMDGKLRRFMSQSHKMLEELRWVPDAVIDRGARDWFIKETRSALGFR